MPKGGASERAGSAGSVRNYPKPWHAGAGSAGGDGSGVAGTGVGAGRAGSEDGRGLTPQEGIRPMLVPATTPPRPAMPRQLQPLVHPGHQAMVASSSASKRMLLRLFLCGWVCVGVGVGVGVGVCTLVTRPWWRAVVRVRGCCCICLRVCVHVCTPWSPGQLLCSVQYIGWQGGIGK